MQSVTVKLGAVKFMNPPKMSIPVKDCNTLFYSNLFACLTESNIYMYPARLDSKVDI